MPLSPPLLKQAELEVAAIEAKSKGLPPRWFARRPEEQKYAGLANEGGTCYLNSLLQALFMSEEVRKVVYSFR